MAAKTKPFGECKLCGKHRKLVDSHIIPEFCHTSIYDHKGRAIAIWTDKNRWRQQGYKEPLLCADCEKRLNTGYEQPFHKFWYGNVIAKGKVTEAFPMVCGFDYHTMKLFYLSVLWRCHWSTGFGDIALGPYADMIKNMLLAGDAAAEDYLPIGGYLLFDDKKNIMDQLVSIPGIGRFDHSRFYVMQYAGCDWWFLMARTLSRKLAQFANAFGIKQDGTVRLIAQHYKESRTYNMIVELRHNGRR